MGSGFIRRRSTPSCSSRLQTNRGHPSARGAGSAFPRKHPGRGTRSPGPGPGQAVPGRAPRGCGGRHVMPGPYKGLGSAGGGRSVGAFPPGPSSGGVGRGEPPSPLLPSPLPLPLPLPSPSPSLPPTRKGAVANPTILFFFNLFFPFSLCLSLFFLFFLSVSLPLLSLSPLFITAAPKLPAQPTGAPFPRPRPAPPPPPLPPQPPPLGRHRGPGSIGAERSGRGAGPSGGVGPRSAAAAAAPGHGPGPIPGAAARRGEPGPAAQQ